MGNKRMVVFPALIYLATFGASIAWLVVDSVPGTVYSTQHVQVAGTAAFSCSVAMNMTTSVIISTRLLLYRRTISQAIGAEQGQFYLSYLAMTLESAALYTVFVIITLGMFTTNSPLLNLFFPVLGNVQVGVVASLTLVTMDLLRLTFSCLVAGLQVIAPSLIIYRIARGISFGTDGYRNGTLSTIHFASETLHARSSAHQASDVFTATKLSSGSGSNLDSDRKGFTNSSTHELRPEVEQV
ncbi:hypothetical protein JVU11DRAFT_10339 [Chiua virens]|nr:hypothetical protein JVU11DRAFT_10339 [Chiua virens]